MTRHHLLRGEVAQKLFIPKIHIDPFNADFAWALPLPDAEQRPPSMRACPLGGKAQSDSGGFISYLAQDHHRAAGTVEKGAALFPGSAQSARRASPSTGWAPHHSPLGITRCTLLIREPAPRSNICASLYRPDLRAGLVAMAARAFGKITMNPLSAPARGAGESCQAAQRAGFGREGRRARGGSGPPRAAVSAAVQRRGGVACSLRGRGWRARRAGLPVYIHRVEHGGGDPLLEGFWYIIMAAMGR